MDDFSADLPFRRSGPDLPASPVVLSVPHAGRGYSTALLQAARLPREKLECLEDRLVDRLIWRARATGATAIIAHSPRAEIDLNRDEREIDPATVVPSLPLQGLLQTPRTRGGLGLIPARIAGAGAIWRHRTAQDEVRRRIEQIHHPYHAALDDALERARAVFGVAILLDCHSMPPRNLAGGEAELVFGDRHGTSASADYLDAALSAARAAGYTTAINVPYAGGYIATRHGKPGAGIHAIQLEIDRALYLDVALHAPGKGFDAVARMIAAVTTALASHAVDAIPALAAE